jgi:hypothetical protein
MLAQESELTRGDVKPMVIAEPKRWMLLPKADELLDDFDRVSAQARPGPSHAGR